MQKELINFRGMGLSKLDLIQIPYRGFKVLKMPIDPKVYYIIFKDFGVIILSN